MSPDTPPARPHAVSLPAFAAIAGLVHGFARRAPGASSPETRAETRSRVSQELGAWGRLQLLRQVHGARVVEAPYEGHPEADAQWTACAGVLLGIETADCLPVLVVDPRARQVAAAHAGWRGTASGVAAAAVAALVARGARPEHLLAGLGPCIGPCCYEVGDELRPAFGPAGARFFRPGPKGRAHLDLRAANRAQLEGAGLDPGHVHQVSDCTYCLPGAYFSYRRDGPAAGRMISYVGFAE